MFPYRDENPTEKPAIITVAIIIANALVFILLQGAGAQGPLARSVCELGLIPGELLRTAKPGSGVELAPGMACLVGVAPKYWTVITSMFTHGGWLHLIGNMLFLWVFGNNIEDAMGHGKFIVFYLLCGITAAATQTLLSPHSIVPMVGASGAISGVLGAVRRRSRRTGGECFLGIDRRDGRIAGRRRLDEGDGSVRRMDHCAPAVARIEKKPASPRISLSVQRLHCASSPCEPPASSLRIAATKTAR